MSSKKDGNKIGKSRDNRDEVTLFSALKKNDKIPFHMPGHKRNEEFEGLFGREIDVTEIAGTDNLHDAQGILKSAMQHAADVFGVKATRFLIGGSTCGVLATMRALTRRGDAVVVARNCHKSVFNAIELLGLQPEYVLPEPIDSVGVYGSVKADDVKAALERTGAKLVVLTSPTYEGIISDVQAIAEVCHSHGAKLFVDEAHGAHLGLCSGFEKSARTLGADVVVNSLHKTLPSLTQTALLHVCSDDVDVQRLDESLAIFETSSPSYVLMTSIDECVRYVEQNENVLENWAGNVDDLRAKFASLKRIKLFDASRLPVAGREKIFATDKSKLVFLLDGVNLSGVDFADVLRDEYGIELEMASKNYAIAMTGAGDTKAMYSALERAVKEIDERASTSCNEQVCVDVSVLHELPKKAFNPCEIDGLTLEYMNISDSAGRVSAESIWAYPPGAPIVVKGEIVDEKTLAYIIELKEAGVNVASSLKSFPKKLAVVRE
ncbi:MAG: aminotransferase class V-fold PLP-dependent enzyme [Clostridia bacterium]|nr:aminotransferase class V-fold PLP-dependent enzyme [Clostridia bacterium]